MSEGITKKNNITDYSKVDTSKYSKDYNETSFWEKVKEFAIKAGIKLIYNAVKMYYSSQSSKTPAWAITLAICTMGYFIAPVDLIPDIAPGGFVDDAGVLATAMKIIESYITQEIKIQAKKQLKNWFGDSEIANLD